jgi:hypothetical protein
LLGLSRAVADTTTISGDVTENDPVQMARLFRTEVPSVAGTPKPFPGLELTTLSSFFHYDAYSFTNNTGQSATVVVTLDELTASVLDFSAAYLGSSNPFVIVTNPFGVQLFYLADAGMSGDSSYSFDVAAGPHLRSPSTPSSSRRREHPII